MGAARALNEPVLAFRDEEHIRPALVVRVNFGVFAGRNATQAEIDDLARSLTDVARSFAIVAEERHEFGREVEAMVRQIVIQMDGVSESAADEVVARADEWASACIASRSNLGELSGI
jgi:hypothetical protein